MATRFTRLATGTSLSASLLALFGVGTLFLGGDVVTDPAQNTSVDYYYGSGAYLSYDEERFTASGANRFQAQIQNLAFSGAILEKWSAECNNKATAQNFDIALTRYAMAGTGNGINVASDKTLGDGGAMSGSSVRVPKWPRSWYFTILSSSGSAASQTGDCLARIWYRGKFGK